MSAKTLPRKFVSVDPSKCIGCGICEYACTTNKGETNWNPIHSRIRVVRMAPVFNFALTCRGCVDAKCVISCPERAITQSEVNNLLIIDEKKCKGCDWCVQACPHGGITIHPVTGKAIACNLCEGDPQCIKTCPEEALELVECDEDADKRFNDALSKLPEQTEHLMAIVKKKDWKPLISIAEQRSERVAEKLEALNKHVLDKKQEE
ncbi:MAG: 4Fe-4S dicluster domain-containing protein [Candidatus Bathyarchaeota archaeon]|nr:4Fe-4S dicluster domain-containing protein [Candidatus Bathyarchaeota archaeon]MDI9577395.1 4Fe-4S dicluster domain-containing protein [Thermoproteota archaeon]MDT8782825.1 4Fe-4S dicluster domain-containing protein [Candidatus Bathyarchaeota archaeon]